MRKLTNISRKSWTILSVFLVLTGILMYLYPHIANLLMQEYTVKEITSFKAAVEEMQEQDHNSSRQQASAEAFAAESVEKENLKQGKNTLEQNSDLAGGDDLNKDSLLNKLLEKAEAYNEKLYAEGQKNLIDPFSYEVSSIDLSEYGIEDNMFGYLEIPKLKVILGIYLGATAENMSKGAVHLTQTSLPIGGINTNAVIAAHRGSRNGEMFQFIDKLEAGDEVMITNAWETLTYSVTSIAIIDPKEIDKVLIQEGRDMITLLSCNPYGKNIQRYVVYCDRVEQE